MDTTTRKQIKKACKPDEPVPLDDPRHHNFDREGVRLRGLPWRERLAALADRHDAYHGELAFASIDLLRRSRLNRIGK